MKLVLLSSALVAGLAFFCPPTASASPLVADRGVDSCIDLNCGALFTGGISQKNTFGDSVPFTVSVFADAGECLRLDVVDQSEDMEIALLSPSGRVLVNDDFNGLRPLITAVADVKGYYTVQVNQFTGNQLVNSGQVFTLAVGRYFQFTPNNCPVPSTFPF